MGNMFYSYCPNNKPDRCSSNKQSIIDADLTEQTVTWDKLTYITTGTTPTSDACSYKIRVPEGLYNDAAKLSITFTKLDNINAYLNVGWEFDLPSQDVVIVPNNAAASLDTPYSIQLKSSQNLLITVTPTKESPSTAFSFKFKVDGTENPSFGVQLRRAFSGPIILVPILIVILLLTCICCIIKRCVREDEKNTI